MSVIRKISIGPDYKNGMHYQVGQTVCRDYEILYISRNEDGSIDVLISKGDVAFLWKSFNPTVPISVEYNIDF